MNKTIQTKIDVLFVKKEEKQYQGNTMYYLLCNSYDSDGMATPLKIKVSQEIYNLKFVVNDTISLGVNVESDYLRVTATNIYKNK